MVRLGLDGLGLAAGVSEGELLGSFFRAFGLGSVCNEGFNLGEGGAVVEFSTFLAGVFMVDGTTG